ncbi:helix-turn-helix domain-containing protein [Haloarculaceae archaeon H-GB2-1]|nr:helix-turn-helix domain-containing protein [Haloarculaceae archaeon H-GB1-1]MEA5386626.1 helix-turn-helix domain-containing protein [Haloarculaceae archaeon H-GB11]MEA5408149.1 helix-turn-helix domain-containing protein [Haloarculaceae archaeon H-GB2-1]
MSVIVELTIPSQEFELGRVLSVPEGGHVELDAVVPLTSEWIPFIWLSGEGAESVVEHLEEAESVSEIQRLNQSETQTLIEVDWTVELNDILDVIREQDAHMLSGSGTHSVWRFELRFPNTQSLSTFRQRCDDREIPIDVQRVYELTKPDHGRTPDYGLTVPQREALVLAIESGYYEIPRRQTTVELADQLGISDQAVTERLRRAITSLVQATLTDPIRERSE